MTPRSMVAALILALGASSTNAFTVSQSRSRPTTSVFMTEKQNFNPNQVERGVSVDQDGKSNVWAIEPKMEVDTKSSEEKMTSNLLAVGGFAAFAAVAAGILTNLPDPDQF